jgi:hypothetical protein
MSGTSGGGWVRPYPPGTGRWVVAVWELLALAFLQHTTVAQFALGPHAAGGLAVVLAGCWAWLCWRLTDLGVYIGPVGLQVRGLVRRRTVPWAAIDRIVVDRMDHTIGRLRIPAGRTVVIDLATGGRVDSTLWADGVDFKFRPALFTQVYATLRAALLTARAEPAPSRAR